MAFTLFSDCFADGGVLRRRTTCDGASRSPSLRWFRAPAEGAGFACSCPPRGGGAHRQVFRLIALGPPVVAPDGARRLETERLARPPTTAAAEPTGRHGR